MSKQSFMKGTMILVAAGLMNRILGFIPRITLPRIIGPEGIGLYQMGWPFLIVLLTFITGGIPLAVAKMVAQADAKRNERQISQILRVSLALAVLLAIVFTLICLIGAKWITSHLLTDPRVYLTFLCMSPIIGIVAFSSVLRGYFQGRQNMIPTATSQIAETLIRIVMVLFLASFMMRYGVEYAAAGAMIGVMIGELSGLLILFLHYRPTRTVRIPVSAYSNDTIAPSKPRFQLKQLLLISLPVTGSKLVGATSYLLESILIMQSLAAAGIVTAIATAQYGALQGMVFPILLLPSALTYSLSTSLIPSLSEAAARNDMSTIHKRLNQSLRLAMLSGAPFAVIMFVLAEPLCMLMYNQPQVGTMLKMMAPIALLIYVQAPLQATLQALDRPGTALINTLIGAAVKLTLIAVLASKPELGILGAIIAINVNILIVTILHWVSVSRLLRFTFDGSFALKVGFAMLLSGASCYFVMSASWEIGPKTRFLTSFTSALLVFTAFTPILKLIDRHDIQRLFMLVKKAVKL